MKIDLLDFEQVTEMRRRNLARLVETHTQAVVARRTGRVDRQISDMIKSKSFGEKVALEMERAWFDSAGEAIDLIAPRPREEGSSAPNGWNQLDELGRMKVEAYISGLLAQSPSLPSGSGRFQAD